MGLQLQSLSGNRITKQSTFYVHILSGAESQKAGVAAEAAAESYTFVQAGSQINSKVPSEGVINGVQNSYSSSGTRNTRPHSLAQGTPLDYMYFVDTDQHSVLSNVNKGTLLAAVVSCEYKSNGYDWGVHGIGTRTRTETRSMENHKQGKGGTENRGIFHKYKVGELTTLLTTDFCSFKNFVSENISRDRGLRALTEAMTNTDAAAISAGPQLPASVAFQFRIQAHTSYSVFLKQVFPFLEVKNQVAHMKWIGTPYLKNKTRICGINVNASTSLFVCYQHMKGLGKFAIICAEDLIHEILTAVTTMTSDGIDESNISAVEKGVSVSNWELAASSNPTVNLAQRARQ
ncbi:AAA+ ATPase domain-containing protein [Artemisia annua]|uniref:AAA+ ATPase domain-containing protein n=1 Tax=Artemisia annua TaxID=35608 RepID=A0A2U1L3R2_ARTAN|nr:AAA+ ATPase domain-containing protein [Artemisia annua]